MNVNLTFIIKRVAIVIALLLALGIAFGPPTNSPSAPQPANAQGGLPFTVHQADPSVAALVEVDEELTARFQEVIPVMITLDAPAAIQLDSSLGDAAQQQAAQSQASVINTLDGLGIEILYRHTTLTNALQARVSRADAQFIATLPGVKDVAIIPVLEGNNASSVPFINADDWWVTTGNAGAGTTIAIIDSGVQYNHYNFGRCTLDRGTAGVLPDIPDGSPFGIGDLPASLGDESYLGADCKVVGGIDLFSGDDDPMSCNPDNSDPNYDDGGHGTHVAGSAAGYGVLDLGGGNYATYTGPYDATTFAGGNNFLIGPGVAPEADILAVRVLGCSGSTGDSWVPDPVTVGIEWSVANGADVINMSLGSSWSASVYETVITNATNAGVVVVASAGNSGDIHYITGAPASSTRTLSVAASDDRAGSSYDAEVIVNAPYSQAIGFLSVGIASEGAQVPPAPGLTRPVSTTTPANGCGVAGITEDLTGKIALIQRGDCTFSEKILNAEAAGADAVIVWNATQGSVLSEMFTPGVTIPSVFIGFDDGQTMETAVLGNPPDTVNVTLQAATVILADTVASFTSRGPRRANANYDVIVKPDIAAPGASITSSVANDSPISSVTAERPAGEIVLLDDGETFGPATGYPGFDAGSGITYFDPAALDNYGGTSMSSPHIAGVMALLKAEYGSYSTMDLKALAMNNTVNLFSVNTPGAPLWGPSRVGAGRIEFSKLLQNLGNEVLAYNFTNPELVSVSWGTVELTYLQNYSESRLVRVENLTGVARGYTVSYEPATEMAGVTFNVPASINVPASGVFDFQVTLSVTGATLDANQPNRQDAASTLVGGGSDPNGWFTEAGGYVTLTPTSGTGSELRVPVYAIVRLAGDMSAPDVIVLPDTLGQAGIPLSGTPAYSNNNFPIDDVLGQVTPFELGRTDPAGDLLIGTSFAVPFTDLEAVGAMAVPDPFYDGDPDLDEDVTLGADVDPLLFFGIATHNDFSVMNEGFYVVNLDTCNLGIPVFAVVNGGSNDLKTWSFIDYFDVFGLGAGAVLTLGSPIDEVPPAFLDMNHWNNDAFAMAAPMALFDYFSIGGVSCLADGTLNYWVQSETRYDYDGVFDVIGSDVDPIFFDFGTPIYQFDPATLGAFDWWGGVPLPTVPDLGGVNVEFGYDVVGLPQDLPDILLLHHHNATNTAEIVDVQLAPSYVPYGTERFVIGDWTTDPLTGAIDDNLFCTSQDTAEVFYETSADAFSIIHRTQPTGGEYAVEVDGALQRTVNTVGVEGFATENFSGFGAGYHLVRIYKTDTNPVCIDAFVGEISPTFELPPSPEPILESSPGSATLGTTQARANCNFNSALIFSEIYLDGQSATYELSTLFIANDEYYQSYRFSFPGLGFPLDVRIGMPYANVPDPIIPGYDDSANRGNPLPTNAELVYQIRDENGICNTMTVDYNCSTGAATITQNDNICAIP